MGLVEQEIPEEGHTSRSQNVVHVMPRDDGEAARLFARLLGRTDGTSGELTTILFVPTADDAMALARSLNTSAAEPLAARVLVPITSPRRARRLLEGNPCAVAGTPGDFVGLLAQSSLQLSSVRLVGLLWLDELLQAGAQPLLETLFAEMPKESERVATITALDDSSEGFLERFMRRARRVSHASKESSANVPIRFVTVSEPNRGQALRSLLDATDPESARIVTFTEEGEEGAGQDLAALGYPPGNANVSVTRGIAQEHVAMIVLYDEAPDANTLREASSVGASAVALIAPARVAHFRAMAGPQAAPMYFTGAIQAARASEDSLRDELRSTIRHGAINSQVLQLEPLFIEHDPVEVAAAALSLLQKDRLRARRMAESAPVASTSPRPESQPGATSHPRSLAPPAVSGFTRVYLNVGERDGARRGDLVGAITGEAGIAGAQIGTIELRETHSVVEIASDVVANVIEKLGGTSIRGRRVFAREDREPGTSPRGAPARRGASRDVSSRDTARGEYRGRPKPERHSRDSGNSRGAGGSGRSSPRGVGGSRSPRDVRGGRQGDIERVPRAARESGEWTQRADRLRNARRGKREDR
jgi:ATP-dependent RNA helicase DeaD